MKCEKWANLRWSFARHVCWIACQWNRSLFLKFVVTGNVWRVCVLWTTGSPSLCMSPPPSPHSLTKLMIHTLQQHIAISRSIWGAQIVQNIPKNASLFLSLLWFPSLPLMFLFASHLTSPPLLCPPLPLYFWGLCKSINEIMQTNDPIPASPLFPLFISRSLVHFGGLMEWIIGWCILGCIAVLLCQQLW